ncbi:MAG: DUF503 domain-containing protein [Desulfobacca sp.]|uniref:DUF503 domain-containing protein n=1 Tax=Desulfobacca sp. TaxID=2067990 RepID=UPI00404A5187
MIIALARLTLHLPDNQSLKGKRKVIKGLIEKIRHRFDAAVAEVADHDLWQRSQLGMAMVSNDTQVLDARVNKIIQFIEDQHLVQVIDSKVEFWHW